MVSSYSSDDFEFKLVDGIIELKIEGERLPGSGQSFARQFQNNASSVDSDLIIFNIREAYHALTQDELASWIERVAALFNGYTLALIIRPDQVAESMAIQHAHEAQGGTIKTFSRHGEARDWIQNPEA